MHTKYRKVTELYVRGRTILLGDEPLWMQVLSPFEQDECRLMAQATQARMRLAINDADSAHGAKVKSQIEGADDELLIGQMIDARTGEFLSVIQGELEVDEEWADVIAIIAAIDISAPDAVAQAETIEEKDAVIKAQERWLTEIGKRLEQMADEERTALEQLPREELEKQFRESWLKHETGAASMREYRLLELSYAARVCDATRVESGESDDEPIWDHSSCDHSQRAFTPDDVRGLPEEVQDLLAEAMAVLNMAMREAKDLGSQVSSSEPSRLPNDQEGSESSTEQEASPEPPGT